MPNPLTLNEACLCDGHFVKYMQWMPWCVIREWDCNLLPCYCYIAGGIGHLVRYIDALWYLLHCVITIIGANICATNVQSLPHTQWLITTNNSWKIAVITLTTAILQRTFAISINVPRELSNKFAFSARSTIFLWCHLMHYCYCLPYNEITVSFWGFLIEAPFVEALYKVTLQVSVTIYERAFNCRCFIMDVCCQQQQYQLELWAFA